MVASSALSVMWSVASCASLLHAGSPLPHAGAPLLLHANAAFRAAPLAMATAQEVLPTSGTQPWGSWRHTSDAIELELLLEPSVNSRDLRCEVFDGWLAVFEDASYTAMYEDGVWGGEEEVEVPPESPPLLFGRLAQLVLSPSLEYDVMDASDGRRTLTVTLQKASDVEGVALASGAPTVFDETLTLRGEACLVPGLSSSGSASEK